MRRRPSLCRPRLWRCGPLLLPPSNAALGASFTVWLSSTPPSGSTHGLLVSPVEHEADVVDRSEKLQAPSVRSSN